MDARPAHESLRDTAPAREKLRQLAPHIDAERPVPFGPFIPIEANHGWQETDWSALLADAEPLWAVADGVGWPGIAERLSQSATPHTCLYSTQDPQSRAYAPWLLRLERDSPLLRDVQRQPAMAHSFILLQSQWDIDRIRRHLRQFTMLRIPTSADVPVYFRFYDPRVMVDMFSCMKPGLLARFMQPFSRVAVQLSPLLLMPPGMRLTGPLVTAFDDAQACLGRLIQRAAPDAEISSDALKVSQSEFARFTRVMEERAVLKLARRLHQDHGAQADQRACRSAAALGRQKAAAFGMTTVEQVTVVSRAILLFGADFDQSHAQAGRILTNVSLLPWQKKNQLSAWFLEAWASNPTLKAGEPHWTP